MNILASETTFYRVKKLPNDTNCGSSATVMVPETPRKPSCPVGQAWHLMCPSTGLMLS